jgi:ankyrin repeat protein
MKIIYSFLVLSFTIGFAAQNTTLRAIGGANSHFAKPTTKTEADLSSFDTVLLDAAVHGNISDIRAALSAGANINAQDDHGLTALHITVLIGKHDIATELLARGIDVSIQNSFGKTALHLAAYYGRYDFISNLITNNIDSINIQDSVSCTALHYAVEMNHPEIVDILLRQHNINTGSKDCNNLTALEYSLLAKRFSIALKIVLRANHHTMKATSANKAKEIINLRLIRAVKTGTLSEISAALQAGANIHYQDTKGRTALLCATRRSDKVFDMLRHHRKTKLFDKIPALDLAIWNHQFDTAIKIVQDAHPQQMTIPKFPTPTTLQKCFYR